jgi:hypothetical protein
VVSCQAGLTDCDGTCRDLTGDPANCGACDAACDPGQVCASGGCVLSCQSGLDDCGGSCRDLQTDPAHCGDCATQCAAGTSCVAGSCSPTCQPGLTACDASCANLDEDPANCGQCGQVCAPGQANTAPVCSGGACGVTCEPSFANCNGTDSDGCEIDLANDVYNCGQCFVVCPAEPNATPSCLAGLCGVACLASFGDCDQDPSDGCEATLLTDPLNCGTCGRRCGPTTPNCTDGACTP